MRKTSPLSVAAWSLGALFGPALLGAAEARCQDSPSRPETVTLTPKAYRAWSLLLPNERFADVGSGFAVAHEKGARFAARTEGELLRADLDADGKLEALVEGREGFLTLSAKSEDGRPLSYSVRVVRPSGKPWKYTCGGTMAGRIGGTKIELIDQNLNGSYADFGEDAMLVGDDTTASFLSKVVSIDGKLWSLEVERDGSRVTLTKYAGPSGELDLQSAFECKATLDAAVVVSADRQLSFSLAGAKTGLRVPAGTYTLHNGRIALGDSTATLKPGRAQPLIVASDAKKVVAWGGPVKAEFAVQRKGGEVGFSPSEIWYYGKLGEEYSMFMPLGKSPDFTIKDEKTGEVLVVARFPGSC